MKRNVLAIATAATMAIATVVAPTSADARGGRIAAGVIGGLAAGALIGGALGSPHYYPGPAYYYFKRQSSTRISTAVQSSLQRCAPRIE